MIKRIGLTVVSGITVAIMAIMATLAVVPLSAVEAYKYIDAGYYTQSSNGGTYGFGTWSQIVDKTPGTQAPASWLNTAGGCAIGWRNGGTTQTGADKYTEVSCALVNFNVGVGWSADSATISFYYDHKVVSDWYLNDYTAMAFYTVSPSIAATDWPNIENYGVQVTTAAVDFQNKTEGTWVTVSWLTALGQSATQYLKADANGDLWLVLATTRHMTKVSPGHEPTSGLAGGYFNRYFVALDSSAGTHPMKLTYNTVPVDAPATPTNPAVSMGSSLYAGTTAHFTWDDVTDETYYKIQVDDEATFTSPREYTHTSAIGQKPGFWDVWANSSTTYYYRVAAGNTAGQSDFTSEVHLTTTTIVPPSTIPDEGLSLPDFVETDWFPWLACLVLAVGVFVFGALNGSALAGAVVGCLVPLVFIALGWVTVPSVVIVIVVAAVVLLIVRKVLL